MKHNPAKNMPTEIYGQMKRSRLFKFTYCATILSILLPFGLAGSSWVRMTVGGGLALIPIIGPLLMLAAGLTRCAQVWIRPSLLDGPVVAGYLRPIQMAGISLIYAGALIGVASWLSAPIAKMFIKDAGPNGILYYAIGVYLALLNSLGALGLIIFEATRLAGFEKIFSQNTHQVDSPASELPTFRTMGLGENDFHRKTK